MSDILIKGMEMPTSCKDCPCFCEEYFYCRAKEGDNIGLGNRPKDCPLVPVPPHGRLIDADALKEFAYKRQEETGIAACLDVLDISLAPTIIEADEGE